MAQESEGLQKLTAYMNQIRKQSEHAIDFLNIRVKELEAENSRIYSDFEKCKEERDLYKSTMEQLKLENNAKWKLQERDDWRALVESLTRDRDRLKGELCDMEAKFNDVSAQLEDLRCSNISRSDNDTDSEVLSNPDSPPESPRESPVKDQLRRNTDQNRNIAPAVGNGGLTSSSSTPSKASGKTIEQLYRELQRDYQELQQQEKFHRLEAVSLKEQYAKVTEENHHLRFNVHHGLQPGTYAAGGDSVDDHTDSAAEQVKVSRGWFGFGFGGAAPQNTKRANPNIILHV